MNNTHTKKKKGRNPFLNASTQGMTAFSSLSPEADSDVKLNTRETT